jgi:hypothetical protein
MSHTKECRVWSGHYCSCWKDQINGLADILATTTPMDHDMDGYGMQATNNTEHYMATKAKRVGCKPIYPAPHQLFIDIDSEEAMQRFNTMVAFCRVDQSLPYQRDPYIKDIKVTPSKSGLPKRHIVVELDDTVTNMERIALQAIFGSDPVRELLAFFCERNNSEVVTCFFEKKGEK